MEQKRHRGRTGSNRGAGATGNDGTEESQERKSPSNRGAAGTGNDGIENSQGQEVIKQGICWDRK